MPVPANLPSCRGGGAVVLAQELVVQTGWQELQGLHRVVRVRPMDRLCAHNNGGYQRAPTA